MNKNKIFYQDFLMDFPYDENEYPIVNINYIDDITYSSDIGSKDNLFDFDGKVRTISFQKLHDMLDIEK